MILRSREGCRSETFGTKNPPFSVISDGTNKVVANVTVGNYPTGVAYDSVLGKVFVANSNNNRGITGNSADNTVSVILDSSNKVVANVTVGASPSGVACDSVQGKVFVTNINDGTISVISDKNYVVTSVKPPAGGGLGMLSPSIVYDSGVGDIFVINGLSIFAISGSNNTVVGKVSSYSAYANQLAYDSGKGEIFVSYTAGSHYQRPRSESYPMEQLVQHLLHLRLRVHRPSRRRLHHLHLLRRPVAAEGFRVTRMSRLYSGS